MTGSTITSATTASSMQSLSGSIASPSASVASPTLLKQENSTSSDISATVNTSTNASSSASAASGASSSNSNSNRSIINDNGFYDDEYNPDEETTPEDNKNKLEFVKLATSIRQAEIQVLQRTYDKVKNGEKKTVLCLIHGLSGTGKSTLLDQFTANNVPKDEVYVLRGKFDNGYNHGGGGDPNSNPLSAIIEAFAGLPATLKHQQHGKKVVNDELQRLQRRITEVMGGSDAVTYLGETFPALKTLLGLASNHSSGDRDDDGDEGSDIEVKTSSMRRKDFLNTQSKEDPTIKIEESSESTNDDHHLQGNMELAWNRIQYLFQALARAVSTMPGRQVIFFLDDLQWCDKSSRELLDVLLRDPNLSNILFVGAYRTDEVDQDHPLVALWHSVRSCPNHRNRNNKDNGDQIVSIEVTNLTPNGLKQIIQSALRIDADDHRYHDGRIEELARAIHDKTEGNIFFTKQVLTNLHQKNILRYSGMTSSWEWDFLDVIQDMSDTVLEAVTKQLMEVSEELQHILKTIAYMRRTIDVESLDLILTMEGTVKLSKQQIIEQLDTAVKEGFMTRPSAGLYSFAHDRIQQAAFQLIPEDGKTVNRHDYRYTMGYRLYRTYNFFKSSYSSSGGTRDWMILSAADHINATYGTNEDAIFLAKLNLEAGRKCMAVAAFEAATKYLSCGLKSVECIKHHWEKHYNTSFGLYTHITEAELALGHLEQGQKYAEIVLQHAETKLARLPIELALAKAFGRENLHKASFEMSRDSLRSVGAYPKTWIGTNLTLVRDLLYVKRYFQTHSDEDILNLPVCKDKKMIMAVELYISTAYRAWFCGNDIEFLAGALKSIRTTLKYGLTSQSGTPFVGYSLFCDKIGDGDGALRFAKLGLELFSRSQDKSAMAIQVFTKAFFLDAWSVADCQTVLESYDRGCKIGMENGDFENAIMCTGASLDHAYASGRPLEWIDSRFANVVAKENMYALESIKRMTVHQWLPTQYLRGTVTNPKLFDFDELLDYDKNMSTDGSDNYARLYAFNARLQIAVYYGKLDFLEKLMAKYTMDVEDRSHSAMAIRLSFMSIAYGMMYRESNQKRRKYLEKGKRFALKLKRLSEEKGMNSWHRYLIASAHLQACSSSKKQKKESILCKFEQAMELASQRDVKQDVALGAQLVTEYLLWVDDARRNSDQMLIKSYLKTTLQGYRKWGATHLVQHLETKYSSLLLQQEVGQ